MSPSVNVKQICRAKNKLKAEGKKLKKIKRNVLEIT